MKPIETKFMGYRFRSRLEAKWAVFFEALGLNWEYEAASFNLGSAGLYLPDFRLQFRDYQDVWVEVKSDFNNISAGELAKMLAFGKGTDKKLVIADGLPGPFMYATADMLADPSKPITDPNVDFEFSLSSQANPKGRFGYQFTSCLDRPWWDEQCNFFDPVGVQEEILPSLFKAIEKARSARFEHGETPRV